MTQQTLSPFIILLVEDEPADAYLKPVDMGQLITIVKKLEDYWCTLVRVPKQKAHGMFIQSV